MGQLQKKSSHKTKPAPSLSISGPRSHDFEMKPLFSAAVTVALAGLSSFAAAAPVLWQAHSYDDLREWPQLFTKANSAEDVFVKVDPQWLPPSLCVAQQRANSSDARGCFVLNHDAVTATSRGSMNTTADLLSFIGDPAHAQWFSLEASRVHISLCFKGCGGSTCPCSDDPATTSWLSLADDFFAAANAVVAERGLNVEFVLDGAGNPGSATCLADRWRPWRSVFITGDDPAGAYTANNASVGWDRLVMLNQPLDLWPSSVSSGYGKFVSPAAPFPDYPFLIWEPSDQPSMLAAAGLFQNSSAGGTGPSSHAEGLRFAINIDPAQAEVYLAPAADPGAATAWNNELVPSATARFPAITAVQPSAAGVATLISAWIDTEAGSENGLMMAAWSIAGGAPGSALLPIINASVVAVSGMLPDPSAAGAVSLRPCLAAVQGSADSETLVIASTLASTATAVAVDMFQLSSDGRSGFVPAGSTLLPLPAAAIGFAASVAPCVDGSTAALCAAVAFLPADASSSCAVYLSFFILDQAGFEGAWTAAAASPATCLVAASVAAGINVSASAISLAGLSVSAALYALPADGSPALAAAVSFSANGTIFGATACASLAAPLVGSFSGAVGAASSTVVINDPFTCFGAAAQSSADARRSAAGDTGLPAPGTAQPLVNHVGSQPGVIVQALTSGTDVGTLPAASSLLVLESHSNGYCPNSETHNKEADVGLCDQVPLPNAGGAYVNYNAGPLTAWAWQLLQRDGRWMADPSTWPGASPCSLTMAHGMVDMGAHPAPLLMVSPSASATQAGASSTGGSAATAVYAVLALEGAGTAGAGVADPLLCGAANNATGLRLDGWRLPTAIMTGGLLPQGSGS